MPDIPEPWPAIGAVQVTVILRFQAPLHQLFKGDHRLHLKPSQVGGYIRSGGRGQNKKSQELQPEKYCKQSDIM